MSDRQERTYVEHVIGQASEFPSGTHKIVKVQNLEIGVYNVDGVFYAMHNVCPHQFGPACAGPVSGQAICSERTNWQMELIRDGEILVCPWHGMEFDLKTGQCLTLKQMRLRSFPVSITDGEIRVQIAGRRAAV